MKNSEAFITGAISEALTLGALTMAPVASAVKDGMPSTFIVLPDGICEKIVGGSFETADEPRLASGISSALTCFNANRGSPLV